MKQLLYIELTPEELKDLIKQAIAEHDASRVQKDPYKTLTVNQTAIRMGRSHYTIQKLVGTGKLTMVDGRITEESIEKYYQTNQ